MQMEITSETNNCELPLCSPVTPSTKRERNDVIDEGVQESLTKQKASSKVVQKSRTSDT